MKYENHELPADGNLIPLLEQTAKLSVDERGDVGDFSPFDWVNRMYESEPDWRDRIDDAYAALLTAPDPLPRLVLDMVAKLPVRSFLPRLYSVIEGRCAELAGRTDTTRSDGRSLLGSIVHVAASLGKVVHPSPALARELAQFERVEDGWPRNLRLAVPGDVDGLFPKLVETLNKLDEHTFYSFIDGMVADGPPWTDAVFAKIGSGDSGLRDRVVRAVKRSLDEMEAARGQMSMMTFDDPEVQAYVNAAAAKPNPWPDYAARLGVDAGN